MLKPKLLCLMRRFKACRQAYEGVARCNRGWLTKLSLCRSAMMRHPRLALSWTRRNRQLGNRRRRCWSSRLLRTKPRQRPRLPRKISSGSKPGAIRKRSWRVASSFIAIADAERIHAEEVANVREEYEQAVASASTKDGDASEVAQSDIGDAFYTEDDEGWRKMEKGKRKTMLERSGRIVPNKVKKLSKCATARSPFAKAKAADAAKGAEGGK